MAEKSIQISIAAVGAGQTAAEINSVTTAVKEQGDAISQLQAKINISDNSRVGAGDRITGNPFQTERDERVKNQHFESINAQKDMEDEAAARAKQIEQEEAAALAEKELAAAKKATAKAVAEEAAAEEAATVARENANRSLIMNIGRYSGLRKEMYLTQSAGKALGATLNLPVMLGILAVSEAIPHLIELFRGMGKDSEDSEEKITKSFEKIHQAVNKLAEIKGANIAKNLLGDLSAEKDAFADINKEIEREISLINARHRAEVGIVSAQAALDLEKIDANKSLSESDKIRQKAKIEENLAEYKHQDKLSEIEDKRRAFQEKRSTAANELSTHEMNLSGAEHKLNLTKKNVAELEDAKRQHDEDVTAIAQAEKEIAGLQARSNYASENNQVGEATRLEGEIAKRNKEVAAIKGTDAFQHYNPETVDTLIVQNKAQLTKLESDVTKAQEDLKSFQKNFDNAHKDVGAAIQAEKIERGAEMEVFSREKARTSIRESASESTASEKEVQEEQKKKAKAQAKEKREAQRARERDLQSEESSVPIAEAHAREVFEQASKSKTAFPKLNNSIEDIAKHLEKNPSLQELEKLFRDFTTTTQGNNSASINILRTAITTLLDHKRVIELLTSQIRGARIAQ